MSSDAALSRLSRLPAGIQVTSQVPRVTFTSASVIELHRLCVPCPAQFSSKALLLLGHNFAKEVFFFSIFQEYIYPIIAEIPLLL